MQRKFEPMVKAVEAWRENQISDVTAKRARNLVSAQGAIRSRRCVT
jgi:hypothetical protein